MTLELQGAVVTCQMWLELLSVAQGISLQMFAGQGPLQFGQESWLFVLEKVACLQVVINSLFERQDQNLEGSFESRMIPQKRNGFQSLLGRAPKPALAPAPACYSSSAPEFLHLPQSCFSDLVSCLFLEQKPSYQKL